MKRNFNGKISCVMVTQPQRAEMAQRAIAAFRAQTWADKELVIITEGDWHSFVPPDLPVTWVHVPENLFTLGDLRNFAVARCEGDFIAQWDDDDVSHPERLEQMANLLLASDTEGVYLSRHIGAWPAEERYWISHERRWECTTLLRRHRIPIFPAKSKGEDTPVIGNMYLAAMDAPHLYVRVMHGHNTWGASHFRGHWERRLRECNPDEQVRVKQLLDPTVSERL